MWPWWGPLHMRLWRRLRSGMIRCPLDKHFAVTLSHVCLPQGESCYSACMVGLTQNLDSSGSGLPGSPLFFHQCCDTMAKDFITARQCWRANALHDNIFPLASALTHPRLGRSAREGTKILWWWKLGSEGWPPRAVHWCHHLWHCTEHCVDQASRSSLWTRNSLLQEVTCFGSRSQALQSWA